jgi:acyl carrier protein
MPDSIPSVEEVSDALCMFVAESMLAPGERVQPEDNLAEHGIESFALIEIVLFLERRFSRPLPLHLLTPDNTRSIAALSACYACLPA